MYIAIQWHPAAGRPHGEMMMFDSLVAQVLLMLLPMLIVWLQDLLAGLGG